ncbi:MAG: hypothetical protein ACXAB9_13185 [Candidatus Thorarchaeota archaeon]|jgi:hypothetical protein
MKRYLFWIVVLVVLVCAIAIAQAPPFREASGIPDAVEEIRVTTLELARQLHYNITKQIAAETSSPATHVYTYDGWIDETIWLPEAQASADYWAAQIANLEALAR